MYLRWTWFKFKHFQYLAQLLQISTRLFSYNTNVSRSLCGLIPSESTFPKRNKDDLFSLVCGLARSNEEFRDFFFANISTPLASALHSLQDTILADFENDSPELNEDIPMPDLKRRRKVEEVSTEEGVDIKRFKVEGPRLLSSFSRPVSLFRQHSQSPHC